MIDTYRYLQRDTNELISPPMSDGQHRPAPRHADGPVVGLTGARFGGATGRRLRQTAEPAEEPTPEATDAPSGKDGPVVGRTGARFAQSVSGRRQAWPESELQVTQGPPGQPRSEPPNLEPDSRRPLDEADWVADEADWEGSEESYGLVRPYSWTKGRTASRHELAIEALISATASNHHVATSPEHHAILRLCSTPRSVAEVAALL